MKIIKKPCIKIFRFTYKENDRSEDINRYFKDVENDVNAFINSDKVDSVVDIKTNMEIAKFGLEFDPHYSRTAHYNHVVLVYTVIYYPSLNKNR